MLNTKKSIANIRIMLSIVLLVAILFSCFAIPVKATAFAEVYSYSDVLTDLSVDNTFNINNYPFVENDYNLQVIQIAESVDNELFVYVYSPSPRNLLATSISLSTTLNQNLDPTLYYLSLCSSSQTLYKYRVKNFTVSTDEYRYYSIFEIFRKWIDEIDGAESSIEQTYDEKSCPVLKQYEFGTINGNSYNSCVEIKNYNIVVNKWCGYCEYHSNSSEVFHPEYTDNHWVAFSTEYPIDELQSAKVSFVPVSYFHSVMDGHSTTRPFPLPEMEVTVSAVDEPVYSNDYDWYHNTTRTWNTIQTTSEFIESESDVHVLYNGLFINVKGQEELREEVLEGISETQWVLRFYDTDRVVNNLGYVGWNETYTRVTEVTILHLVYRHAGKTYNVGVIDNKQTESALPANITNYIVEESDWIKELLSSMEGLWSKIVAVFGIIILLILIVILCIFVPPVWNFVKFIGKCIFTVISLPFKFISRLFGGGKGSKRRASTPTKYKNIRR